MEPDHIFKIISEKQKSMQTTLPCAQVNTEINTHDNESALKNNKNQTSKLTSTSWQQGSLTFY